MDLSKYAELFVTEGREHIAEMNAALVELERPEGSDKTRTTELVGTLFRAVHSVKGMGGAMGYSAVMSRAHVLEALLEAVRAGQQVMTPSLVAHLFDESDLLASDIERAYRSTQTLTQTATPAAASNVLKASTTFRGKHVRVSADRLDALMTLAGELEIARGRLSRVTTGAGDETVNAVAQMNRLVDELREQIVAARMVPVGQVFDRFPHLVRETARTLNKEVDFVVDGKDIELDRSMLDEIGDPVLHLLRNALDHGLERADDRIAAGKAVRGRLTLSAQRESSYVLIRVADDGRGIDRDRVVARARSLGALDVSATSVNDAELLGILVRPGFTTTDHVTDISGRGVGLDVVDATVRALGGSIELRSVAGRGTVITLRMPLTVAVVRALIARLDDETFAIPVTHVTETVELNRAEWCDVRGREHARVRDDMLPIVHLRELLSMPARPHDTPKAVTINIRGRRAAIVVDDFIGQQDIVVKQFDAVRGAPALFGGATILSDGIPALIVDVNSLV